jgi:hypothetical protein
MFLFLLKTWDSGQSQGVNYSEQLELLEDAIQESIKSYEW